LADENTSGPLKYSSRKELREWLESLPPNEGRWVAVAIAARAVLRSLPRLASLRFAGSAFRPYAQNFAMSAFLASALARVAARFPHLVETLPLTQTINATNVPLPIPIDEAFQVILRAANGLLAAVARAANIFPDDDYVRSSMVEAAFLFTGDPDFYTALRNDVSFINAGGDTNALACKPLWAYGPSVGMTGYWRELQTALPRKDDWQVWIDWYNRRLEGVSDPEEIELIFATVPDKEREAGPATANKWIKERLEELQKKDSPPPEIPRQGPGPHFEIDAETGAVVPAKPEALDAEGNNLARLKAHHPRIVQLAGELLANLGQNEHPELYAAAKAYFDNVNRDLSQIDFERLWGEGVYLEEAAEAATRDIKNRLCEPLNDAALTALNSLLRIHGPFILATKAGLENLADANAFEMRPDEAKEQRAAAIELAQEFKANPAVVAPEMAANFAHFAEKQDSTKHPERSSAFRMGMALNAAIVLTAGATIGVIIVEIGLATGNPIAGLAALPLVEGLKKSKPFLEVSGVVTDGLNKLSEADARALWERLRSKIPFDRYRQFVLDNEALFRRLAGSGKQSRWLHEILDWLTRTSEPSK
jgi:hypothetical protein